MAPSAAMGLREPPYRSLHVYSTKSRLYVVGFDDLTGRCRILKLNRQDGPRLEASEDPVAYTPEECAQVLASIHEGASLQGGLQLVCKAHGIIGCFRFTEAHYLLLVTRREYVGHICGHQVYSTADTVLIPLGLSMQRLDNSSADSTAERRYRKLLLGVDLSKNFFFSYTYSLAHTLQYNHTRSAAAAPPPAPAAAAPRGPPSPSAVAAAVAAASAGAAAGAAGAPRAADAPPSDIFDSMFVWNAFLTRPLRAATRSSRWALPLVHGFWEQRQVSVFGQQLTLTLLARRSRHFAGTRFLKRGLNDRGRVANEVETEQVVDAGLDWATGQPAWSSVVQLRGSVPLFWTHQGNALSPKPDIVLQHFDPLFSATQRHLDDLRARYSNPIVALNLLKSSERRPRETLLRREYGAALAQLNEMLPEEQRVVYIPWDFQKYAKQAGANILLEISTVMKLALDMSGIYVHGPASCPACQPALAARCAAVAHCRSPNGRPRRLRPVLRRATAAAQGTAASSGGASASGASVSRSNGGGGGGGGGGEASSARGAAAEAGWAGSGVAGGGAEGGGAEGGGAEGGAAVDGPWYDFPKARATAPQTQLQHGVLRTNCVDCLDRTNVAQFALGLLALGRQVAALGLGDGPELDIDCSLSFNLMEMYEGMGHTLALQYGGSEAHAAFFQRKKGEWEATTHSRDIVTSIRRFYSNAYTDAEKQGAINLLLGNYVPRPGQPALWELDSDYYLHYSSPGLQTSLYPHLLAVLEAASPHPSPAAPLPAPSPLALSPLPALPPARTPAADSAAPAARTGDGAGSGDGVTPALLAASAPGAGIGLYSSPLLPLSYSDGITLDVMQPEPAAGDHGWDFGVIFQQLHVMGGGAAAAAAAAADGAAGAGGAAAAAASAVGIGAGSRLVGPPLDLAIPMGQPGSQLLSLDQVLQLLPRLRQVRMYPAASARRSVLWDAVQHAFTFFTLPDAGTGAGGALGDGSGGGDVVAVGVSGGTGPRGGVGSAGSVGGELAAAAEAAPQPPGTPVAGSEPVRSGASGGSSAGGGGGGAAAGLLGSFSAMAATAQAGLSSGLAAAGSSLAARAGVGGGLSAPLIPALNDILEIRTDEVAPGTKLISGDRPPLGFGNRDPANRWLDATLEELAWGRLAPGLGGGGGSGGGRGGGRHGAPALNDFIEIVRVESVAGSSPPTGVAALAAASGTLGGSSSAAAVAASFGAGGSAAAAATASGHASAAAGEADAGGASGGGGGDGSITAASERAWLASALDPVADWGLPAGRVDSSATTAWSAGGGGLGASVASAPSGVLSLGGGCGGLSAVCGPWVSSADVAAPTLQRWAAQSVDGLGMAPEVAMAWLGCPDGGERWAAAEAATRVAYTRYCGAVWQLMAPGDALTDWYRRQQLGGGLLQPLPLVA